MPIYEYICEECGRKYDKFVRSSSSPVKLHCPDCGSEKGKKAFSAFSTGGTSNTSWGSASNSGPACGPVG